MMYRVTATACTVSDALMLECSKCGPMGVSEKRDIAMTEANFHMKLHGVKVDK
jgi:hypothetical protein